jgi:hypothetical protein
MIKKNIYKFLDEISGNYYKWIISKFKETKKINLNTFKHPLKLKRGIKHHKRYNKINFLGYPTHPRRRRGGGGNQNFFEFLKRIF